MLLCDLPTVTGVEILQLYRSRCQQLLADVAGVAAASTGAAPTAEAGQEAASGDSDFSSPEPGSEFSPEQPMEGDLGGDDFDLGQTGICCRLSHCQSSASADTYAMVMPWCT